MAEVALKGVSKRFGHNQAVDGIDLAVADGEFVVLLGPTGAGKTRVCSNSMAASRSKARYG